MRSLRIGYWPLSPSLKSAGDRRRLVFWARVRGHTIVTDLDQKVDVVVASENSDFNSKYFTQRGVPVIFDLVDAYLSPRNSIDDIARGIAKGFSGQISGHLKPFSNHVRDFCIKANSVICSSVEQEALIAPYNLNTHVILDSHEELPFLDPPIYPNNAKNEHRILWEGQPATIRGIKSISRALSEVSNSIQFELDFVTDIKFFQLLNKYVERDTMKVLEKDLGQIANLANIIPWSPNNLVKSAKNSDLALIPLDLSVPIQNLKPENRLLIMWRLGIPCLTSPSPAYARVARQSGASVVCDSLSNWSVSIKRLLNDSNFAHNEIVMGQNYLREYHTRGILLKKWDLAFESVIG
jgi:hypothetical protein